MIGMGTTVRIKRPLDSETVHLPEVHDLVGRDVEIVVREIGADEAPTERYPLRGSVLRYDDPFEPITEGDWEALAYAPHPQHRAVPPGYAFRRTGPAAGSGIGSP